VLPGVAAAVVALGFQPLRQRARHLANRLVYGRRATPYEVLADFSERVAGTYAAEDIVPRMARILADGTGAARAEVWLRIGDQLRRVACWPADEAPLTLALRDGDPPELPGVERAVPVRHHGELLGALGLTKPRGESVTPAEERLMANLASQAGLVLRNVRLIEELRASRQRLVAAQDEERRRLERNIHDGAQQQLVALAVKLRLLSSVADRDAAKAKSLADQLQVETQDALENVRDLARGIFPPLLADRGLPAAIEAQARKSPVAVEIAADGVGRYPAEVEATVYFCVLEALQNVAKYADASRAVVRLGEENGSLVFQVEDDGRGFETGVTPRGTGLQNMTDRVEAAGGMLEVISTPGRGTSVAGRIPVEAQEAPG
jgi:signal transduction histidine kinase